MRNMANIGEKLYKTIMHNAGGKDSIGTYTYIRTYVRGRTDILLVWFISASSTKFYSSSSLKTAG